MKLIIVGDTPSKTNSSEAIAFVGAKCYPRLTEWLQELGNPNIAFMVNSTKDWEIEFLSEQLEGYKYLAVGKKASQRLKVLGIEHYTIDHPSGLNRNLNNKVYVKTMLTNCKKWIQT